MKVETKINKLIKQRTGINIFDKSKSQPIVDARGLFDYILRRDYNYTYQRIADFYTRNKKYRTHDTVLYSVKNFERDIQFRREDLANLYDFIVKTTLTAKQYENAVKLILDIDKPIDIAKLREFLKFNTNEMPVDPLINKTEMLDKVS